MEADTSSAPVTPGAPSGDSTAENQAGAVARDSSGKFQGKDAGGAKSAQGQGSAPSQDDEFEEVKIGSVGGKVPKAVAKAVKDLERGFHEKSQMSATERKQFQALVERLKNPDEYFKFYGHDADSIAEARLAAKLEQAALSPEQKKAREQEAELQKYREDERARKEKEEKQKLTAEEQKADQEIRQGVMKAWQASGLPDDPKFGQWIVATKMTAEAQGLDWTWEDCASRVREDFEAHFSRTASKLDAEALVKLLGNDALKKLRQHDVAKATAKAALKQTGSSNSERPPRNGASPKKNFEGRPIVDQDNWDSAWNDL